MRHIVKKDLLPQRLKSACISVQPDQKFVSLRKASEDPWLFIEQTSMTPRMPTDIQPDQYLTRVEGP